MLLLGYTIIISNASILSESVNIGRKSGIGPQHLISWVDAFLPAPVLMGYSGRTDEEARENMVVGMATKDVRSVRHWAKTKGAPTPVMDAVHGNCVIVKENGHSGKWEFLFNSRDEGNSSS